MAADVVWYDGQHPVTYTLESRVAPVVEIGLDMFCDDMRQVTGLQAIPSETGIIHIVELDKASSANFPVLISSEIRFL